MRKCIVAVAVWLLPVASQAAISGVTSGSSYACSSWNEYEGLLLMEAGGQADAFRDELTRATLAGECTTFKGGEAITIQERKTSGPDPLMGGKRITFIRIAFKGRGSRGWWTSPASVR